MISRRTCTLCGIHRMRMRLAENGSEVWIPVKRLTEKGWETDSICISYEIKEACRVHPAGRFYG